MGCYDLHCTGKETDSEKVSSSAEITQLQCQGAETATQAIWLKFAPNHHSVFLLSGGQSQTLTGNPLDGGHMTGCEVGLLIWAHIRFL